MIHFSRTGLSEEIKPLLEQKYRLILKEAQDLHARGTLIEFRHNPQIKFPQIAFDLCAVYTATRSICLRTWMCQCWVNSRDNTPQTVTRQIHPANEIQVSWEPSSLHYRCGRSELKITPDNLTLQGSNWCDTPLRTEWDALDLMQSCLFAVQVNSWQQREAIAWNGQPNLAQIADARITHRLHQSGLSLL
ncbi:hypothetical protein ACQ4M3_07380 [Leptolyngbya sp. AN03gr2]|uniref:hypothetical protein n=1 Tax=unclassified Leptolyngbya TaxID=2650499 RepID=UPI003D32252E